MSFIKRIHGRGRSKFNALKTNSGFPSKLEASVFSLLQLRERAGEISDIKRQQIVILQDGPRDTRITWRVDFSFTDTKSGQTVYAEAKGFETSEYKIKLKLWRALKPAKLEIWKGNYSNPILIETISAKNNELTRGE